SRKVFRGRRSEPEPVEVFLQRQSDFDPAVFWEAVSNSSSRTSSRVLRPSPARTRTCKKMSVNLSKNGAALTAAYREVVDGKSDTNWVLFTYEGNSNDIRLAEKG
ncbi:Drebrin-like protein B, partial [Larimichthys crocea]